MIGASALGLGAVVVAFLAYRSGASQELAPCAGAAQDVQAVWNDERRDAIAAAFRATGAVHADDTWTRAEQRLDEYASGWAEQATRACVATHVDGTQSTARLELRRRCLAERLQSFDAVLEVMAHANTTMVDRAVQSARGLPDLAGCDDIAALEAGVAPPDQEDVRQQVEQIEAELARIDALGSAARYREQVEMLEDLLPRARATGYLPVVAGVEHALSGSQRALDMPEGMTNLRATFRDALAAGDDRRATMAAIDLAHELGYDQRLHEEGREWIAIAEALLHRIGGDPGFEIGLTNTLAIIAIRQGRFDEAQSLFERLVEKQRARDPESPNLAVALMNLGGAHAERRDYDRAREYMEQAAELTERLLGPLHPSMTSLWANLAAICVMQGRYEEAKVELRRALELQRKVLGERHPEVARSLVSLAVVERNLGDPVESERLHRQALEIRREKHGNDHPEVAESLRNLAHAVWDQGRDEEAIDLVREAEEIASRRLEPGHYEHGLNLTMLASLLVYAERYEEALEAAQRAIAVLDASGRGPADGIEARGAKGGAERGLERYDAAIVTLEEALRIAAEAGDEAALREDQLALIRFELALVLQESGRDPARAHQLATQARDGLRNASAGRDRERSTVETWLREHPAP